MKRSLAVAGWRLRRTAGERWGSYVGIVVVIGLLGGLSLGAIAGARRTQASFPTYLASTNPSDASAFVAFGPVTGAGSSPRLDATIAKLQYVRREVTTIGFDGTIQLAQQLPASKVQGEAPPAFEGSTNGEYSSIDRVSLVAGRLANPRRPDELEMTGPGAASYGLHVGSTLRLSFYTLAETLSPAYNGGPHRTINFKLVGIVRSSFQIVQSDDAALGSQFAVFTPALTRQLEACCAFYSYVSLQLVGGLEHLGAVEQELRRVLPAIGGMALVRTSAPYVAEAETTIRPESLTYGIFGLFAAIAALLVALQLIGGATRRGASDGHVLRALGAGRLVIVLDRCLGVIISVVIGAALAVAIAVALSPLAPIGPVRPVYPDPGVAFDGPVLGFGGLALVVLLSYVAIVMAVRVAPRRRDIASARRSRPSQTARVAAAAGLGPAAVTGIRFALDPGSRDDPTPVRSAIFGAVLAVVVLASSVTFGSSLSTLVARPSLYGWNWDFALLSGFSGAEDLDGPLLTTLLNHDPTVAKWSGVSFTGALIDGQRVPVLAERPGSAVAPTLLSGRSLRSASEVVLAPGTLAELHRQVGDTVQVSITRHKPVTLRIVGTATMPTIGGSGSPELRMGTGAVLATSLFSSAELNDQGSQVAGPNAALIVIRPGVDRARAVESLAMVEGALRSSPDSAGGVVSVLRPAEIVDYRTIGSTPTVLAAILSLGAIVSLGLVLVASVRRRRRELAMLKTLGFTRRQVAVSVAWQATVPAVIGILLGVPLGIALGRWVWTLFARTINVVPSPTVPVLTVALICVGAIGFANVAAAIPGRLAANTSVADVLHAE